MKRLFGGVLAAIGIMLWVMLALPGEKQEPAEPHVFALEQEAAPFVITTTTYLPAIFNRYDAQFPAPLFGMQTYGSTSSSSKYFTHLLDSQASWVRSQVNWSDVEASNLEPAVYNWASTDQMLAVARPDMGGRHIVAVIDYVPSWARLFADAPSGPIRSDALDDFGEFVQAAVERYDGDGYLDAPGGPVVKHWELFNEPDGSPRRWGYYGAQYAEMLAVAYPAIKAADSRAQVLFGGLSYDWFDYQGGPFVYSFLEDVLDAGGGAYFDVMNFHMYPLFAESWGNDPTGVRGKAAEIRAKLAAYGLDKPLVITEAGWHNSVDTTPPSSDTEQITRLVQLVTHSFAADIKVVIWFMLYDPGDFLPNYGLLTTDSPPTTKPAYTAYQTAVTMLGNARYVRDLTPAAAGETFMEAFQFQTNQAQIYVAWMNPYQTTAVSILTVPGSSATLIDALGSTKGTVNDADGDGFVAVTVTDEPIYIQVSN